MLLRSISFIFVLVRSFVQSNWMQYPTLFLTEQPARPFNLTVLLHRHGFVMITWMLPEKELDLPPISYCAVQYRTVGVHWVPLAKIQYGQYSYNWSTASRGATYHFRVVSYSRLGGNGDDDDDNAKMLESEPSEIFTIYTGGEGGSLRVSNIIQLLAFYNLFSARCPLRIVTYPSGIQTSWCLQCFTSEKSWKLNISSRFHINASDITWGVKPHENRPSKSFDYLRGMKY